MEKLKATNISVLQYGTLPHLLSGHAILWLEVRVVGTWGNGRLLLADISFLKLIVGAVCQIRSDSSEVTLAKHVLTAFGYESQYMEIGMESDTATLTKGYVLLVAGLGAEIDACSDSEWNNPALKAVLLANLANYVVDTTSKNDTNLCDFEDRSASLLTKTKDKNGSCTLDPMIRLFDDHFDMEDIHLITDDLDFTDVDTLQLRDRSWTSVISRDLKGLIAQAPWARSSILGWIYIISWKIIRANACPTQAGQGFTHVLHRGLACSGT